MDIMTTAPPVRPRASDDVREVIEQLKTHPGEWVSYSDHATRGAARQRVHALRAGSHFRDLPVQWATRRHEPGNIRSRVGVYVRWLPEGATNVSGPQVPALPH